MGYLKNEKGQMAIFIALFFQVLFVFFAMAINVGLVVHDKINLQNSVDMAAYYGAMKQAEVLNQIAHINYQMRQNYKLFAWRYRVLGTLGHDAHPYQYSNWTNPILRSDTINSETLIDPSICVSHSFFQELQDMDPSASNICRRNSLGIPAVPQISSPVGFVPGSGQLPGTFAFIQQQLNRFCMESGIMNWVFAARILAAYRSEGAVRKAMIGTLASALSQPEPMDLRNESIREGAYKTFQRNLTDTNRSGEQNFQYYNSLGDGQCSNVNFWLADIKITPLVFFNDWTVTGTTCDTAKSIPNRQNAGNPNPGFMGLDNLPFGFSTGQFGAWTSSPAVQRLIPFWQGEPNDDRYHSSVGFEKNPWCMIYTGIRATTAVRKPFDPTGGGVVLEARGFAKPFGGRMGPWYGTTWPQGNPNSQAGNQNLMVDPNLPSRNMPGGGVSGQPLMDAANYSRYPGDPLGLKSMQAMSAMVGSFWSNNGMPHRFNNQQPAQVAVSNYDHLGSITQLISHGDSLPRVGQTPQIVPPRQRPFELAAVAPDTFDAIYYSIEPKYYPNYFFDRTTGGGAHFPNLNEAIFDIGSQKTPDPLAGGTANPQFDVAAQIQTATVMYMPDYPHIVRNWEHLLTSWHQRGVVDFTLDPSKFGQCAVSPDSHDPQLPTTGNCIQGGRTGYSVKPVSMHYLLSDEHALGGGQNATSGAILNPPPADIFIPN